MSEERSEADEPIPEQLSLIAEFWLFLRENKKWWMIPILVVILLFGALMFFAQTPAAPLIYTLF